MREKYRYRRYLSMAMTAVMTLQLCAPTEAVWGAAAHKTVKIITEFAELPESVSHIQIPAGVEEAELEQYLQFPETLEAYVMDGYLETGSSDHKKATDSNAQTREDAASATPSDSRYTVSVPESVYEKATDSNTGKPEKATSNNSTIEESSASDSESDEDDEYFEEEDLFVDIPVLTDIAVTWEQDEEREAEDGSMYYLPVLPTEYVLADGVELPEIQVSVESGIALMNEGAIQVTMNGKTDSYISFDDWMSDGTVADDCEIKLMENTELTKALTFNSGTITLDLNGKTLDTGSNNIIIGSSNVTIQSDGAGGTITGTQTIYDDRGIIRINTDGNCLIQNNVKIQHTGNSNSRAVYNGGGHLEIEAGAEFSVCNGSFSVEIYYGTATIAGGTFYGGVEVREGAGKVEISGGTFYPNGSNFGSLCNDSGNKKLSGILKQGYGLQKTENMSSVDLEQNLTKDNVQVVKYSIYFSTQPVIESDQATVLEGYQTAPQLIAEATTENSVDEITYQWHVKKTLDGTEGTTDEMLTGANSGTYQIPDGLFAGTYEYYCVATHGNDTAASNVTKFTVTQGYVQTVINGKIAGYLTLQEALTAIDNAVTNVGNENADEITIELKFLADSINRTEVTWILDGTDKKINLTVDLNGCKAGYSPKDGVWNSNGLTFTLKGVHATLKDSSTGQAGYLNGFLIIRDQAGLTVESGSYENVYLYSGATATLNGGACRNRIDVGYSGNNSNPDADQNAGISCTITGGIYQNVNVYGGAGLAVAGENTRIEKTLKAVHDVGGSPKRAEVSLAGGYYNKIQVELADNNELNDADKRYAVADMLSAGYVFFASGFLQTVARTATFADQVTVVPADTSQDTTKAVAKIVITTRDDGEITNYYSSWESAISALSQGNPDAAAGKPTTWKKVELLLLKDATVSANVVKITNGDVKRLPDDITVSSAEGGNYTLTGSSDSVTPILLWADSIQNLKVKNIKLKKGKIQFAAGNLTISQDAEIVSDTNTIVAKGNLIVEENAKVETTQGGVGAIQLSGGGTVCISGSQCQIFGANKAIYFSGDTVLVLENGAKMPKLGNLLNESDDCLDVICKDSSQADFNNTDTGVKLWYPVTLPAGVILDTSGTNADTVKEYEGQIYGLGWADSQEGQKEITVDTGICSYVQTNDSNSVKQVISDSKFQMPAAAVTLLTHKLNEQGMCQNCNRMDLAAAYQKGLLHIEGLTDCTYNALPQKLTRIMLVQANGTSKELTEADPDGSAASVTPDYTADYVNSVNAYLYEEGETGFDVTKAPQVTITGQGTYIGSFTVYYRIKQAVPEIGNVTAAEQTTLDVSQVVLSRSNTTIAGTLKLKDETLLQYGTHEYEWRFEPTDHTNYVTVEGKVSVTVNDVNPPTVQYRKNGSDTWEDFSKSTVSSGCLWNVEDTMEIRFRDAESGIATQQYYIADQVMDDSALNNAKWVNYTMPFKLRLGNHIVYVKAMDHYGNQVILHSNNFCVYQESELKNTEIVYFYKEGNGKVLHINTNGNTIERVVDEKNQPVDQQLIYIETTQGQLTLNQGFLDSLGVGQHFYKIRMWPQGNQEAPRLEYEFCVTVNKMPLEVDSVKAAGRAYNGSTLLDITEVILKKTEAGLLEGVFADTANLQGTLESADAGTYKEITLPELTLTGTEAGNYKLIQPTAPVMIYRGGVIITKAPAPAITWPTAETIEAGQELQTSKLTGGSTEYGTFTWKNPDQKAEEGTHTYDVIFTPNAQTEKNYDITELMKQVSLMAVAPASVEHEGEIAAAESKVAPVAADAPQEVKDIANVLQNTPPAITGLETAAKNLLQTSENGEVQVKTGENQTITGTQAKELLQNEGINTAGKTVKLVVEPYMEVAVNGVTEENGKRIISLEISARYNVKATTAGNGESMEESGIGRNTMVIGTGIQQQVDTPVTITIPLPADYPVENLFIRHILHSGKNVYYPVTVTAKNGVNLAKFVNKDGFSTFELLSDGRSGSIIYDQEIGTRSYTLEQVGDALPAVSRSGYRFLGWKISGTIYTDFTLELLNLIDTAEGKSVTAEAVLEQVPSGSGSGGSGSGSSSSGSGSSGGGSGSSGSVSTSVSQGSWSAAMADGITKWRFADLAGVYVANTWKLISWNGTVSWYHFGADGYMDAGWLADTDGHWYYLNPVSDGTQGAMITGWRKIDGVWYYFNPVSDGTRGAMYHGRKTPDGYYVDESGAWDGRER